MATKKKTATTPPTRILTQIQRKDAIYMGVCSVQAKGAWTRCGPTWTVPGVGWIVYGPGVAEWKTTKGLAQISVEPVTPTWHATAWGIAPEPNIVFAVEDHALPGLTDVQKAADATEHLWSEG